MCNLQDNMLLQIIDKFAPLFNVKIFGHNECSFTNIMVAIKVMERMHICVAGRLNMDSPTSGCYFCCTNQGPNAVFLVQIMGAQKLLCEVTQTGVF